MYNTLKSLVFISVLTIISINLHSQNTWSQKLKSNENTFKQVQDDFNEQWSGQEYVKGHGWKQFHRWENFWEDRLMPDGTYPDFRQAYTEYNNYMSNKSNMMNGNWLPMGPFSHVNTDSWSAGSGRVNVVVEDPNDPNTLYVGAPAGGIWKSIDAGSSWTPLGDEISVIGVSGIAVDPSDSDVIYIATGDADAGDTYSIGLMKSIDGGLTWNLLQNIGQVNKILIDPTTTTTLWASGSSGLYKSTDSGATWIQKQAGNIRDMAIKPGNSQVVYCVSSSTFYYTNDGGNTVFNTTTGLPGNSSRMVIGVTPANNSLVYVIATTSSGGFGDVYKSVNSGASFTGQNVPNDIFDGSTQSWYDLAIGVSDSDENTLFCGVLNVWKSTDGGSSWAAINSWSSPNSASYTHADIHYLNFYNGNFYCGSDGGIYKSTDHGDNFTDLTDGLQIGQFYKIGGSPNDVNVLSGGLQDNGGYAWNGTVWRNYHGADGMDNAVDPNNSDNIYGMIQYGGLYYSTNGGLSNIGAGGSGQDGRWITPTMHDLNNDRLVVGYDDLFEFNTNSYSWNQLSTFNFPGKIRDVEIYDGNSNIIFVSSGNNLYKTTNNGTSFNEITGTLPGNISSIEVNPADDDELWVSIGGWVADHVYHTTNGGGTWTDISNGLPNLPTNMIKYDSANDGLYLGMDIGIYFRNDILGAWVPFNTNLPNVIVRDIEINEATSTIRIGTYGRGVWTSGTYDVPVLTENVQLVSINAPEGTVCVNNTTPEISVRNIGSNTVTDLTINFNYDGGADFAFTWSGTLNSGSLETISLFGMPVTEGAHTYNIDIIAVNGGVDQDPSDNVGTSNFTYLDGTGVTYTLTTDCYASETSWILREEVSLNIIDQGTAGTLFDDYTYNLDFCLADMCYELELIDSYGDGMSSTNCTDGFYGVEDEFNNVLVTMNNANYGFGITHTFCLPYGSAILGCTDINACNYDSTAQQDDGTCTQPGCTDSTASNYDPLAGCTDNSCEYAADNDICDNAIPVVCGQTVSGSTAGVTDYNIPPCGSVNGAPGLWYSIIGNGSEVTFSTCNQAQYDTKIDIFVGTCQNLVCHAENDDGANCSGNTSLVSAILDLGVEYFIFMNGWNGSTGSYNLTISCDTDVSGCTNPLACNYNNLANVDDGTCVLPDGCTNGLACNYDSNAQCDDGSCILPDGCTNDQACNYDSNALCDDGSCILPDGCTNGLACNYDSNALCDDGSCILPDGCTNGLACNYDSNALCDDGSCILPDGCTNDQATNYDSNALCDDGSCILLDGCTNMQACNYNSNAVIDDGSCILPDGCTNGLACNYDSNALCDDGSCILPDGCTNGLACNYDSNAVCDDGSCILPDGCTNDQACNYDSNALCDDGSCFLPDGCTNELACNYDGGAICDDGSCILPDGCTNDQACNYDSNALCDDGSCILPDGCMNDQACNYNSNALCDDGSCILPDGCTNNQATNYDSNALCDDGSCILLNGCMNDQACNYDSNAIVDDGSCILPDGCTNDQACNYDSNAQCDDGSCILPDGCTDLAASNYDSNALCNDGSCVYEGCLPIGNLTISSIHPSAINIEWDAVNGATNYRVKRTAVMDPQGNNLDVFNPISLGQATTNTFYNFNGLAPGFTYELRVRNDCTGSPWSTPTTILVPYSMAMTSSSNYSNCTSVPVDFSINAIGNHSFVFLATTEQAYVVCENLSDPLMDLTIELKDHNQNVTNTINDFGNQENEAGLFTGLTIGDQYIISIADSGNTNGQASICVLPLESPKCTFNSGYPSVFNYSINHHTGSAGATSYSTHWQNADNLTLTYDFGSQISPYFSLEEIGIPPGDNNYLVTYTANFDLPVGGQIGDASNTALQSIAQVDPCLVEVSIPINSFDSYLKDYYSFSNGSCTASNINDVTFPINSAFAIHTGIAADYWRYEITDLENGLPPVEYDSPSGYWVTFNIANTINAIQPGYISSGSCYQIRVKPMASNNTEIGPYGSIRIWKTTGLAGSAIESFVNEENGIGSFINKNITVSNSEFSIYPNPNHGNFLNLNINNGSDDQIIFELFDLYGRLIQKKEIKSVKGNVNEIIALKNNLSSGVYTVKITIDDIPQFERLIIEK